MERTGPVWCPCRNSPSSKKTYSFYGNNAIVKNVHLAEEGHDYGPSKRKALYEFLAAHFNLDLKKIRNKAGETDESFVTIEKEKDMYVFGENGERLPPHALKSYDAIVKVFEEATK